MNQIHERLHDTYCEAVLKHLQNFPESEILSLLRTLPMEEEHRIDFYDKVQQFYTQWSIDAFSIGLHLGLSLLCDDIRRLRAQEP